MNLVEFTKHINKIKKQFEYDNKCHEAFSIILKNDYVSNYDNSFIVDGYINLLEYIMKDINGWISYYVYDLDFGDDYSDGCTKDVDGKNIKLKTIEDLYNIIKL